MTPGTNEIDALWPRWMGVAGTMQRIGVLVRSQCSRCGTQLRVSLEDIVARDGAGASLIDALERCRVVGCDGSNYFLAARSYGQPWTRLVRDSDLEAALLGGAEASATPA